MSRSIVNRRRVHRQAHRLKRLRLVTRLDVLRKAGIDRTAGLVVTLGGNSEATESLTARMGEAAPHVPIYARARASSHADRLLKVGATAAVPGVVEGSLQLARRVLLGCGSPDEIVQPRLARGR